MAASPPRKWLVTRAAGVVLLSIEISRSSPSRLNESCSRVTVPSKKIPSKPPLVLSITRSEEHTSELQSLMRISYAVFCLKKKIKKQNSTQNSDIHKHNDNNTIQINNNTTR